VRTLVSPDLQRHLNTRDHPSRYLCRSGRFPHLVHTRSRPPTLPLKLLPSTPMQWVTSENQGPPPAEFVGGFQHPQRCVSLPPSPGLNRGLIHFAGGHRKFFSSPLTMFTGLWLRICFSFGSQQQTVTITTPGIADIRFASTPTPDVQQRYALPSSFSHHGSSFADPSQSTADSDRLLLRALT